MNKGRIVAGAAIGAGMLGISALALAQGKSAGGPVATYWMTAETTSGMGAMMAGASRGGVVSAMLSGRRPSSEPVRTLQLQLGSSRKAAGAPSAEHVPPAGLGAGASLPLQTPEVARAPAAPGNWSDGSFQRPKGKLLIYWGCGEKARPGQPVVVDFGKLAAGQIPPGFAAASFKGMTPPSSDRSATYGEWPNARSKANVPARGSLVGDHIVRGNYTPEMRFTLGAGQDFLAPLTPKSTPAASGATLLNWPAVPAAKAYHATVMGASKDGTMVMWSSSATQLMGMGVPDYMEDSELRRLVDNRTLLNASTTSCAVPAEVAGATQGAMLMMTAYGPQSDFSYPPRPANARAWNPEWVAKLRSKSTHMAMLGMEMPGFDAVEASGEAPRQDKPARKKKRGGLLGKIGDAVAGEIID